LLGQNPTGTVHLELVNSADALARRVQEITGESLPSWVAGVAISSQNLVIARTDTSEADDARVEGLLTHEIAHLVLHQRLSLPGAATAPRWFDEGLAQLAEGRGYSPNSVNLSVRAFFGRLIPFNELDDSFPRTEGASSLAYAQAEGMIRFLKREGKPELLSDLILSMEVGISLEDALKEHTDKSLEEWETGWHQTLKEDKSWMPAALVQAAVFLGLILAILLGAGRIIERRRSAKEAWDQELDSEGESFDEREPGTALTNPEPPNWWDVKD
jgi:hypothetical protein